MILARAQNRVKLFSEIQKGHTKTRHIKFENFHFQNHLTNENLYTMEKQTLFSLRTSMANVKANFSSMNSDLNCDLCGNDVIQSSSHLLDCSAILDNHSQLYQDDSIQFEHIFGDINLQINAARIYVDIFKIKSRLEENRISL